MSRKDQRKAAKRKTREKQVSGKLQTLRDETRLLDALEEVEDCLSDGDLEGANEIVDELARRWPNNPDLRTVQLDVKARLGLHADAVEIAEQWVRVKPDDPDANGLLSMFLANADQPGRATLAGRRFLERWPAHHRIEDVRGITEVCERQALENIHTFGGLPDEAGWALLLCHESIFHALRKHDFASVIKLGEEALRQHQPVPSILNNMAEAFFHLSRWQEALEVSDRAAELDPTNLITQFNRVRFSVLLGRMNEAHAVADGIRDAQPKRFDFWEPLLNAFVFLDRDEEALLIAERARRELKEADMDSGTVARLHLAVGVVMARNGKEAEARSHWQRVLRIEPHSPLATMNLEDLKKPVAERNGPVLYPLQSLIPEPMLEALVQIAQLHSAQKSEAGLRNAIIKLTGKYPGFLTALPLLLRIGDQQARTLAIMLAVTLKMDQLWLVLREFGLGHHGSDACRMQVLRALQQAEIALPSPVRFFSCGAWTEIKLFSREITDEVVVNVPPAIEDKMRRGQNFLLFGGYEAAENIFRQVLKKRPDLISARNNLASAILLQKRHDEAEVVLKEILTLEEENVIARCNLARLALRENDTEKALGWIVPAREVQKLHTSEFFALTGLEIDLALRAGRIDVARDLLKSLQQVTPDNPQLVQLEQMVERAELTEKRLGANRQTKTGSSKK